MDGGSKGSISVSGFKYVDLPETIVNKCKRSCIIARVALARIMLMNPKLVLFDEPTSALDAEPKLVLDLLQNFIRNNLRHVFVNKTSYLHAVTD